MPNTLNENSWDLNDEFKSEKNYIFRSIVEDFVRSVNGARQPGTNTKPLRFEFLPPSYGNRLFLLPFWPSFKSRVFLPSEVSGKRRHRTRADAVRIKYSINGGMAFDVRETEAHPSSRIAGLFGRKIHRERTLVGKSVTLETQKPFDEAVEEILKLSAMLLRAYYAEHYPDEENPIIQAFGEDLNGVRELVNTRIPEFLKNRPI